ncbi:MULTISPECIES: hypothetical protein [Cellulomonas]|uniref:hypothetical protein n=1 Tax=Cellulomonas TaxID=1707 RepID=UPI0010A7DB42|nr:MULTISPECIES: hypothetical protein [Cellulomonas]
MAATDATGAAAAAEHFLALMDHAVSTLDAGPMMAMCDPGSRWCASIADQTAQAPEARAEGAARVSADTALPSQLKVDPRDDGTFVVHLTGQHTTTTTWTDPATGITQIHISDPETVPFAIHLESRPSGWTVLGVN